jgi:FAD/FMN-containing dehydrogenase
VLADGTVLDGLKPHIKNNTGVDLKHLFIGSEGILGVVTRAVLRLVPKPGERTVALCATSGFSQVRSLLRHARTRLGGELTAFEVMWDSYYSRASQITAQKPIATGHPFYVLLEASGADAAVSSKLEAALHGAIEEEIVTDAVLAKSEAENTRLWELRDRSVEVSRLLGPVVAFDVSLRIADMEDFVAKLHQAARGIDSGCDVIVYGHLGDGNLHLSVRVPTEKPQLYDVIQRAVYQLVGEYSGSVSAEHGIGISKREFLSHSRSAQEITAMRALKATLDPRNTLNPGRVI